MSITSIGIIGYGDFGKFLHMLAKERLPNVAVKIFSRRQEPDLQGGKAGGKTFFSLEEVCKADIVIPCVPIAAFEEWVEKIAPLLGPQTLVIDVATVKKHTVDILQKQSIPRYLATHPMFGPYSYEKHGKSLTNLRIAVCDSNLPQEELDSILGFLRQAELKVLELTADEHDRLIAETLFLTHLVGQTVTKGGFTRTSIDTVSFGFLMDAVESVAHDADLFRDVYTYNPYCKEVLARYEAAEKTVVAGLSSDTSREW